MKPIITVLAGDLTYSWPDLHIQVDLTALHQTEAGAVRGMVKVSNGTGAQIYWNTFSLTGNTDRKQLLQKLDKAIKRGDGEWELDIDRMCQDAYERHVAVPDPIRLADMPDESPEAEFLFRPVIPDGLITLLLADQGSTKSYLMLYLAACTALGIESVFGPPRRKGPVIYFDWEVDQHVARRRLGWVCRGLHVPVPRDLFYVNMSDRGRLLDVVREMRYQLEQRQAVLAVVDSLTFATGGDLNSPEFAAPTMSAIGSLGKGVTKLISTHPGKASRNANAEDISVIGSALFEFRARAIWLMKREASRGHTFMVGMSVRKPFDGAPSKPLAYRMRFDQDVHSASFEPGAVEDSVELRNQTLPLQDRIRRALERKDLDTNTLVLVCEAPAAAIKSAVLRMPDVRAKSIGGGRGNPTVWTLSPPDEEVASPWWSGDSDEE